MKSRIDGSVVFTLALVVFVVVILVATLNFPPLLRYTPFIAGGLTLAFLAILLAGAVNPRILSWTETALQDMWGGGAGGHKMEEVAEGPSPWPSVLRVMAYVVGYLLGVYFLGFFLVTPAFTALYLILDAKAKPLVAICISVGLSALLILALLELNVDLWIGVAPEILPDYIGGAIVPQF
jgi:hypothetical protein